jgi:hypothetical protein
MKVKIFHALNLCSSLEEEINNFLSGFYKIETINFTYLGNNTILCCYKGETWEAYHSKRKIFY